MTRQFKQIYNTVMALGIVKISFPLNILPVKEITLHVKPVSMMCFMLGYLISTVLSTFLVFPRKQVLTVHANCLHWRQSA